MSRRLNRNGWCHLFLFEYLTSGLWPTDEPLPDSLAREGRAMLEAVARDFLALDTSSLDLTWDARLELPQLGCKWHSPAPDSPGVDLFRSTCGRLQVFQVASNEAAVECFNHLSESRPNRMVIAPEFDSLLSSQLVVPERNPALVCLNVTLQAVELCADKYLLSELLQRYGVACVPGWLDPADVPATHDRVVVKPRWGAGSQEIITIKREHAHQLQDGKRLFQPVVEGIPLSVAAIFDDTFELKQVWPPARQHLSDDGAYSYLGGSMPFTGVTQSQVDALVTSVAKHVPGLRGYVGFDFILTPEGELVLVEINPRLTTSYVGYRALSNTSLAPWLIPHKVPTDLPPFSGDVEFSPSGDIQMRS
ncbi:MAG: ATP-grasp domain-containing protein [Planctomycetaceae bacterium]